MGFEMLSIQIRFDRFKFNIWEAIAITIRICSSVYKFKKEDADMGTLTTFFIKLPPKKRCGFGATEK